jgi:predicted DsbA family dithiol-disulfide isomerase
MRVTVYTDPGCPFGFNAQRQELQLAWHYGDAVHVDRRMIVLSERSASFEELGIPAALVGRSRVRLAEQYGMPMGLEPSTHMASTFDACRAYVGARMHAPEQALGLLRGLRRRAHSDQQRLDQIETIRAAGADAGLAPERIDAWLADAEVERELRADMADTRDPRPEALALSHKLSKSDGRLRYSTSSAIFEHGDRAVVAAGFQPFAVYEVAVASVAPELERRDVAQSVDEILDWAPYALATAEVAELRGIAIDDAREELTQSRASFVTSANDGYWTP